MTLWTRAIPAQDTAQVTAKDTVTIHVNGQPVTASPDETVATVLLRLGLRSFGLNPVSGRPAAPACLMGVCFGCLCCIDERPGTQACLEPVRDGMTVQTERPEAP
jgi:predicted molibdopterin-dependent oxidoreductase YjgC